MSFETPTEKVWKERVTVITEGLQYVEYGLDFVRFRLGGKLYEVKIKEKVNKKLKQL